MGYKYNGSPLALDVAWKDTAGTQYPSNWLRGSTAAQRAAVPTGGITWEADPPWYDQEFYWSPDSPKDIADLKPLWVQKQKDLANSKLAHTDWMVTRKAEAGTASNGASEKKKEDGSSYDPVQYNDIANPDLLEDWPTEPS